jgi:formylglycine-generating enzyme required for sulfatase activity
MKSMVISVLAAFTSASIANAQCIGNLNNDGFVDGPDLGVLLASWGPCGPSCPADISADGVVDGADLGELLARWGPCEGTPSWATVLEWTPDPAVVFDSDLRHSIANSGRPWRIRESNTLIEMLFIPAGSFQMGCSPPSGGACEWTEVVTCTVTISSGFYMGRYEVTQSQWRATMGNNPSYFRNDWDSPLRPVERVRWGGAQQFLALTGMRLPTEAEWEYAYRSNTSTALHPTLDHPAGTDDLGLVGDIAWFGGCCNAAWRTHVVGQKSANALGLHDMAGNVMEFVNDYWADNISPGSHVDPTGPPSGSQRVMRGGSWSGPAGWLRASWRAALGPEAAVDHVGFRVARNP